MTGARKRYDVALSFAGEDRGCAVALAEALRARGVTVFYDGYEKPTLWGKNLYDYLSDLYQNQARYCVIFISKHYAVKLWTKHERKFAQARAFRENSEYILPLRLDETELEGVPTTVGYLDWHKETADSLADAIVAKLGGADSLPLAVETMGESRSIGNSLNVKRLGVRYPPRSVSVGFAVLLGAILLGTILWLALAAARKKPVGPTAQSSAPEERASEVIGSEALMKHIKVLASDEFQGRDPGTVGEELTVKYLTEQFESLGLSPGSPDGTYTQTVPLAGISPHPGATLTLRSGGRMERLESVKDFVAFSGRVAESAAITNSELVFVGYGTEAREFDWDDFKGADLTGKTLVVLINDPAVTNPYNPSEFDAKFFGGKAMTYYGRWTYKFKMAARKGAAGVLIVHETGPAGYNFEVVQAGWSRERFVPDMPVTARKAGVEGWLSLEAAKRLFAMAGADFDALKKQAVSQDFKPVRLGVTASLNLRNRLRVISSQNVIARLEGSDPTLKDEHVIYVAHWDHLGRDEKTAGDGIYNGAVDNASGVAGLLEVARGFKALPVPPKRSVLFIATTAQEKGLLGSEYFVNVSPPKAVAAINFDSLNQFGRTKDIILIGSGNSDYNAYVRQAASEQGRVVVPDPEPEKGFYYRSDGLSFAEAGVPTIAWDHGLVFITDKPEGYIRQLVEDFNQDDYHQPSDEVKQYWDLSGAVEDLRLFFKVGYRLCQMPAKERREWSPGAEFTNSR